MGSKVLKMHDALLLTVCLATHSTGLFLSAFCVKLWQFYAAFGLQFFELAKYGVIRSLLSKCVHKDETGKMFSALAVIAAIIPMISDPAIRLLYNKTLDTFPAAEILLSASILIVGTLVNFLIYTQRWRIALFTSKND